MHKIGHFHYQRLRKLREGSSSSLNQYVEKVQGERNGHPRQPPSVACTRQGHGQHVCEHRGGSLGPTCQWSPPGGPPSPLWASTVSGSELTSIPTSTDPDTQQTLINMCHLCLAQGHLFKEVYIHEKHENTRFYLYAFPVFSATQTLRRLILLTSSFSLPISRSLKLLSLETSLNPSTHLNVSLQPIILCSFSESLITS